MTASNSQHGNILFLILIAVALFAALSYAVTKSSRGGGASADKEKMSTDISAMLQYGSTLRAAVQRLMTSGGCTDDDLSVYSANTGTYENINAPTDKHCHLFDPAGANLAFQKPPASVVKSGAVEYYISGNVGVWDVGLNTCAKTELTLYVLVPKAMCIAINEQLGNTNPGGNPPAMTGFPGLNDWAKFGWGSLTGVSEYGCGAHIGNGSAATELKGVSTGCLENTGSPNQYFFYDVLIGR